MSVTTVAPSAMTPPSTGLRRPSANKNGILSRRAVTIPQNQMALLKDNASWFSNISSGDESAVQSFKAVPDRVRKQLQKQYRQRATAAAEASSQAPPRQAPPTAATALPAAATAGTVDQVGDAEGVSIEDPPPQELAAAQDPPSTTSLPSLRAHVSPPPVRATLPSTAPPAVTTKAATVNGSPEASSAQVASTQPAAPATFAASAAFVAPFSAPDRVENSSPPRPRQRKDKSQTPSPHKRVTGLQTAEQVDKEALEIPATPEVLLQPQFQHPADVPPVIYSPPWSDVDEDEEVDDQVDDEEAGNTTQQDGAGQEGEARMPQLQTEQTPATTPVTTPVTTATPRRYLTNRGLSPNLSSSPQNDIEFQPVQALIYSRSPQAHARAISSAPPLRATDQLSESTALHVPSSPSHTPSSTRPAQSQAQPVIKYADSTAQWSASVRASHQTTALPPQPLSNSSRAPSEDETHGVRRRLMKAPVFPSSSKPKTAAAQSRVETPDPAAYRNGCASRKHSSLARLYTTTTNKNSSSPPSTPGADSAAETMDIDDINEIKRCDSARSTVDKRIAKVGQEDMIMAGAIVSIPVSAPPVSAPPPVVISAAPYPAPALSSAGIAPFAAAGSRAAAAFVDVAVTPAFKVRGPVYHTPAANASLTTPFPGSAVSIRESPSMSPRLTWMLPYETFTSAYPDYTGDLEDFLRACYCLQSIAKARQLASYQFDDVVRSYLEYIEYVHDDACTTPLNLHQWYIENTDELLYNKKVVTRSNVDAILMAYPDKVQSIQQLAESGMQISKNKQVDKPAPALAVVVQGPRATPGEAPGDSDSTPRQLTQQVQPDSLGTPSQPQSFPAGRRYLVDEVHYRDSQDDSGPSNPSNSLLNMSILGSSGESVWHHGQPSSPPGIIHVGGASQSQFLSQDASQDGSLPGPVGVTRPDSQIQSSCLTNAENALQPPSSPIRTSALPPGMDRITYMLQSPPAMGSSDPFSRPHIPSQTVESTTGHLGDDPDWAMTDDENEDAVAETPAKTPGTARAKTTRLAPITASPAKSPAAAPTPLNRKRSWEDREKEPPSSAANPIVVEDELLGDTSLSHTVVHEIIDDQESGDEYSEMDVSLMSVQSAREVRQRSPAVKPKSTGGSRRATIAASDIGIVARMAAAEEAMALASHKGTTTPAPPAAKITTTATPNGPPKKKRKQTAASKKSISRKALADFLAKKAQETGAANKPWLE
ncbi:hypothetical protein F503_06606 [Ophiostoma piceae UAMH 11346]|uniref:Uncharacterized protein n=1 Tax=Ophiostoma piceae (strain UAMH 11346) TaxID=1262450 RepID=S3CB05_OPHP1|nr:hypothetical protein F503_06606 [Ophiostoma piceae UAMH 11346]